ncbi:hypothetical protein SAMD00079811_35750 [Scytonema sp. HK-05]|uniref:hypothetical protein n=1 Tax=Scytonema sp. HK-05 TaxID=1137095 RepID=UPI0009362CDD|nr:hypothetical protein [Scytonema sp. HK-05]OKH60576.1 hypothetical protein NIES2130_02330 [Scytonema sp. HK-05]BAY45968.1 hypothetical protein SAMD00079811_35750 [Scytonema sp. HK-05]
MESNNITLTVIQLDLDKSTESTSVIEKELGVEGTRLLIKSLKKEFVEKAFDLVANRSEYDLIQDLGGDGYRILFKDVNNAYQFVKKFAKLVEEHNINPDVKKRIFRIAATTGEVDYDQSESGVNLIVGHVVLAKLSRLVTATPGWFYIDKTTFDILPVDVQQDFTKESVKGKKHEDDFDAWRCQIFSDTSIPTIQPVTLQEIYDLFKKLTLSAQITRVAQFIGMPNDFRPSNYANLYQAKTAIVDWAEGDEEGEEYRLTRLNKLKDIILQVSVNS